MTIQVPPKGRFHYLEHGVTRIKYTIYARVVSTSPSPDEEEHAEFLRRRYLGHDVVSAVGPRLHCDDGDSVLTDRSQPPEEGLSHKAPQDKREIVMVWEFQEVKAPFSMSVEPAA
jgi:hypothetical protein